MFITPVLVYSLAPLTAEQPWFSMLTERNKNHAKKYNEELNSILASVRPRSYPLPSRLIVLAGGFVLCYHHFS